MVEVYNGKEGMLIKKEELKTKLSQLRDDVVRVGESIPTEISGFSTIMGDNIYFEAVKGGFSGFYNGDFAPSKYITDLNGNIIYEDTKYFDEEYTLIDNKWQKRKIKPYHLKLNKKQIKEISMLTLKLAKSFDNVRTEWILSGDDICLFDVTIEKGDISSTYQDCNILSGGSCSGDIKILEDITILDKFTNEFAIRMGHEFDSLLDDIELKGFKDRLKLKGKIVVCDYPKEHLALLSDEVVGFIFERGSLLCHLGIILREKSIPAIILKDAKKILSNRARVEIREGEVIC